MSDFLSSLSSKLKQADAKGQTFGQDSRVASVQIGKLGEQNSQDLPVLAEIPLTSTELHHIANGKLKCLYDGALGVRFLLKHSFKLKNSNYVVNNLVMQIVAKGKDNVMKREDIAVKTKVQTVTKTKEIVKKKEVKEAKQAKLGKEEVY